MSGIETFIIIVVIAIVIFLVTREFWCWYFKINKTITTLEDILRELRIMNNHNKIETSGNSDDVYGAAYYGPKKKPDEKKTDDSTENNQTV